ncbi:MAG: hypothetical protein JWQ19_3988 [Subtercola sp.]|nr:hypothetical protein [Subtercola sp.]
MPATPRGRSTARPVALGSPKLGLPPLNVGGMEPFASSERIVQDRTNAGTTMNDIAGSRPLELFRERADSLLRNAEDAATEGSQAIFLIMSLGYGLMAERTAPRPPLRLV